ncbi:hypothetical protein [Salmonella enterica]|uniref:hypothetical protein n=1 Tax=Salmonella enterica TaxID=28901 RepID=UPI00398C6492
MTTVHVTTATQKTVHGRSHKAFRRRRGAPPNLITSATAASCPVCKPPPEPERKRTALAFLVPTRA